MNDYTADRSKLIDQEARLVGRRGSAWPWVLGLLLLLAIGGLIWAKQNHKLFWREQASVNPNIALVNGNTSILTDFNSIYQTADIRDLQNRPVEINDLLVTKVIGDKILLLSSTAKNPSQLYVLLNTPASVAVKAGQKYNLNGTLRNLPSDLTELTQKFGLTEAQLQDLKNHLIYAEVQ